MSLELINTTYLQIAGFLPNPMQIEVWNRIVQENKQGMGIGLLIKGPTGSGKTESIAVPALDQQRRLIMIYPTRSLVDDQIERLSRMLAKQSLNNNGKPLTLNIDTGATMKRCIWRDGQSQSVPGNVRRHLYQGDIIVTTLDKFLYRFFGFGEPNKSFIYPLRIHYGLKGTLICFDEAHSYDDVAFTNFARLVRTLYQRGVDIALMTATLPAGKEQMHLDFLDLVDFVENENNRQSLPARGNTPERYFSWLPATIGTIDVTDEEATEHNDELVTTLIQSARDRWQPNQRMIVVAERVQDTVAIWRELRAEYGDSTPVWLYHGRLTQERRAMVYRELIAAEKNWQGYLLITTSAIEVGCDLDAHVLITQLCDPDKLIQRAGRCNRKQQIAAAQLVVVGNEIPEWLSDLSSEAKKQYLTALEAQMGTIFNPKPLLATLNFQQPQIDPRVEVMFDMLYEYVYDARLENKPLHDKGLIITRSWEPSLTLCSGIDSRTGVLQNAVSVPMRSCRARKGESLSPGWEIQKLTFDVDRQHGKWVTDDLYRWQCAYGLDVVAYDGSALTDFDEEVGWVDLPRLFNYSFERGGKRILMQKDDQHSVSLWYISALPKDIQIVPLTEKTEESPINEEDEEDS